HQRTIECPDTAGRRVLIVDDQESSRQIMRELLHHCRYATEEAASGEAALEQVVAAEQHGKPFDFILMDWMMPGGMNGGETCEEIERLRQRGELEQTRPPILMISAYGQEEITLSEGLATDYLPKPLTASSLYDALVRAEGGGRMARAPHSSQAPDLSGCQLLLVEDNAINQEVATQLLEKTGAVLRTAENGREAVEAVRAEAPDLVLMDLQMPVMDGFEATRMLREEGFNGPVIALSAAVMDADRQRSHEAGVDGHLGKPIESGELYAALAAHLDAAGSVAPVPASSRSADEAAGGASSAGETPGEAASASPLPAELPGFDIARGRRHLGGDDALYARLLRGFRDKLTSDYAPLLDHLRAGRDEEARRIAHTLKGAAGTLAVTTLQELAETIDHHLNRGQPVTEEITDALEQAFHEAEQALGTLDPAADAGSDGTAAAVATLRERLEASELVEEATLRQALGYLRGRGLDCDALEAHVEQMEFDEALQSLDELLQDTNEGTT
ncbi:MAG: response regulator, partial [Thiohalospira sp.]